MMLLRQLAALMLPRSWPAEAVRCPICKRENRILMPDRCCSHCTAWPRRTFAWPWLTQ